MAIDKVKEYFRTFGREDDVLELPASSATVELAAQALGTASSTARSSAPSPHASPRRSPSAWMKDVC